MGLSDELASVVGERYFSDKDYINVSYARGLDPVLPEIIPQFVLRPDSTEQVSEIIKIANKYKTPIIPRGGGCGLMGGTKPQQEEVIMLDLKRMNKIISIDEDNEVVTFQAGINWSQLNAVLFDKGYYTGNMGPGSGLAASVGGGLSHHSGGGGGCTKYGECTDNCIGLEVVLGTGEIITLGSGANQFVKKPFVRGGLGPDLMGIFLGDNGTMGVKTTASLKIFPKPPYFSGKTFLISDQPYENARDMTREMIKKGWVKNFGIYDMFFVPPPSIMGITLDELISTWKDITGGVMIYVIEAYDEKVLERNSEILENIAKKYSTKELGPSPEEGNITDWFYGEQGHWQFFHIEFSMMGPGYHPATTEIKVPISRFPEILHEMDKWQEEHEDELFEVDAEFGVSTVHMLNHNSCYIGGGFSATNDEDSKEGVIELWKESLEFLSKLGGVLYMVGQIGSHVLVDSRFFSDEYYNFFKQVKTACDPNYLISPGKFRF